MKYNDIILEQKEHVATIVLNRPDSHNALGGTMGEDNIDRHINNFTTLSVVGVL